MAAHRVCVVCFGSYEPDRSKQVPARLPDDGLAHFCSEACQVQYALEHDKPEPTESC